MSANKLASSAQGLQSSAIRELLKHSKMAGVIWLGGVLPNPTRVKNEGLKMPARPRRLRHLAKRARMA